MDKLKQHATPKEKLTAIILFAAVAVFLFRRAVYGYCFQDEPFLAALAQRFLRGDTPLIDEWNGAQNTGVLILPVFAFWRSVLGGTEGILLWMRRTYCVFWLGALIFLWAKLKPFGNKRIPAIIYLALFSPLDYMTLSYTSVSLICVVAISAVIYRTVLNAEGSPVKTGILMGFLMSAAVLCYPHLALLFVCFEGAVIAVALRRKTEAYIRNYCVRLAVWTAVPAVILAVLYCVYILTDSTFDILFKNISQILNVPQHPPKGPVDTVFQIFYYIRIQGWGWKFPAIAGIFALIYLIPFKRKDIIRPVIFLFGLLPFCYSMIPVIARHRLMLNEQMRNIFFLGIFAFVLTEKKPWKLFISFYAVSSVYTYAVFMASNTGISAISMGMAPAGVAAIIILLLLGGEMLSQKHSRLLGKLGAVLTAAAVLFEIGAELKVRLDYTYYDLSIPELTETIERGPAKGLRTCPKNSGEYNTALAVFDTLMSGRPREGKKLMSVNECVTLYADMELGTFSPWARGFDSTQQLWEREKSYCEINGRPYPDYVFFAPDIPCDSDFEAHGYDKYEADGYTLLVKVSNEQ